MEVGGPWPTHFSDWGCMAPLLFWPSCSLVFTLVQLHFDQSRVINILLQQVSSYGNHHNAISSIIPSSLQHIFFKRHPWSPINPIISNFVTILGLLVKQNNSKGLYSISAIHGHVSDHASSKANLLVFAFYNNLTETFQNKFMNQEQSGQITVSGTVPNLVQVYRIRYIQFPNASDRPKLFQISNWQIKEEFRILLKVFTRISFYALKIK